MKILTASNHGSPSLFVNRKDSDGVDAWLPLDSDAGWPGSMKTLIADWQLWDAKLRQLVDSANTKSCTLDSMSLLPPVGDPEKIICIGKNYADHAIEMGGQPPEIPIVFSKFASTLVGHQANVELPSISNQVDFEAELVVVIGKPGKNINRADSFSHVFGYCCGNDISARDWQKGRPGGQWLLGKTFDTFAPLGPVIVTADEIDDPHQLDIALRLNGETMQNSNTRNFLFPIDVLIEHVSKFVTLVPGDLIFTGTPEGVGAGRKPPLFLKSGDQLEVEIEGLGVLKNNVAAG